MLREDKGMERQSNELYELLAALDLLHYYDVFRREGFERLESIAEIQEPDFEAMDVKRGHRRLIQRRAMELVGPPRYGRDLPPISPPLLATHLMHQSNLDHTASPALGETEPLTAYLHRQHPQAVQSAQGQHQSPPAQSQPMAAAAQYSYSASPYYHPRHAAPLPRPHNQPRNLHPAQQQQQQQRPAASFTHRQPIPFPKAPADVPTVHPPIPSGSPFRPPPLRPSNSPPARVDLGAGLPHISTSIAQQLDQAQQQLGPHGGKPLPQPVSASTDASSPHRGRGAAVSPLSGSYPQTTSLAGMVQAPAAPQRQRGHSMASSSASTAAPATTGTRRRRSRAEPRSPYIRSAADPQSPKSPLGAAQQLSPQSPRRTYRRHPKKDPNAPEKWRSAYQLFRDDVNQELHGQDIAFSEMSKIHSRRWAALDNAARDVYFQRSRSDKEEYQRRMAIYEQTPEFRQYEEYLEKFYKQDSTVNRVGRPKGAKSSKSKGKGTEAGTSAAALEYHHGSGSDAPHAGLSGSSSSPSPQPSYPSVARS